MSAVIANMMTACHFPAAIDILAHLATCASQRITPNSVYYPSL